METVEEEQRRRGSDKDRKPTQRNEKRLRRQDLRVLLTFVVMDVLSLVLHFLVAFLKRMQKSTHALYNPCNCHLSKKGKENQNEKKNKKNLQAQFANLHKWVELNLRCRLAGSQSTREEVEEEEKSIYSEADK